MAFLPRILLAIGLLAVVGAAPQVPPSPPLSDSHDVDTPQEEVLAIEHGFAESQGSDEGSESVHDVEEDTETVLEEAIPTQNDDTKEGITDTNDDLGYSFGPGPHHDTFQEEEEEDVAKHEGSLPDGPTFGHERPSTYQ